MKFRRNMLFVGIVSILFGIAMLAISWPFALILIGFGVTATSLLLVPRQE